jgi:hypothetical protein
MAPELTKIAVREDLFLDPALSQKPIERLDVVAVVVRSPHRRAVRDDAELLVARDVLRMHGGVVGDRNGVRLRS